MRDRIEIGDKVRFVWGYDVTWDEGEVLHIPTNSWEHWIMRSKEGELVYVYNFDAVIHIDEYTLPFVWDDDDD
jgi:hypothetical protein